jgi:methionyl-tRNA formyltransferase
MLKNKIPIIFFGSGPVAAASLEGILSDFDIELVITKPRAPHHRDVAPVEQLASKNKLNMAFADTKEGVDKILADRTIKSLAGLIIDYGVIISGPAIKKFPKGIINSHFSLLPKWRGADPITYCLLAGDKETGVSLMKIVPKLEEGPLIAQEKLHLDGQINAIRLTDRLVKLSNSMVKKYLPKYLDGLLEAGLQSDSGITYSHKIKKVDGIIDWKKPAVQIEREIRAYAGWPKSRTGLNGVDCIITEAKVSDGVGPPGEYRINNGSLLVFTGDRSLSIKRIQPAGKKEMSIEEFLRGYRSKL